MGSGSTDPLVLAPIVRNKPEKVAGKMSGGTSHQEVDTLSLGECSLEGHHVFSTTSALGRTLENQAEQDRHEDLDH